MRVGINGFGKVGKAFAELIHTRRDDLRTRYGVDLSLVWVGTRSHGRAYHADGLAIPALLGGDLRDDAWTLTDALNHHALDALVDVTPTDVRTGGDALNLFRDVLKSGVHVVTANKGPLAVAYAELMALAEENRVHLLFEGTVMSGTPSLRLAREGLAGCVIQSARGILNGTTNYILTQMESGLPYADALAQAQALGYAEPDPSGDVEGWDAAAKVLILSNLLFGRALRLDDLSVTGITGISQADVASALQAGERWKLIAEVRPDGATIAPLRLSLSDPLASVGGAMNAITYRTDLMGDVTLIGAGAGLRETAYALLADLLSVDRIPRFPIE